MKIKIKKLINSLRKEKLYVIYLILILSITSLLSIMILRGEVTLPKGLERRVKPIKRVIEKETPENKLIASLKKFQECDCQSCRMIRILFWSPL